MTLSEWARYEIFGNSLLVWTLGAGMILTVLAALLITQGILAERFRRLADRRNVVALDIAASVLAATGRWFVFVIALFAGSRVWQLPEGVHTFIVKLTIIALLVQVGIWAGKAAIAFFAAKREEGLHENRDAVAAMDILSFIVRVLVWGIVLLLVLDNLGIDITALIAGLGIGGIAIALAAQNTFGDLFASLSIVLDKPFVVGDFIIVGQELGSVERVGVKTTRVRSLSGEQLVFSNNDLLSSRIRNYGRMFERRVVSSLGVTYQTSSEHLRQIPAIIQEAVDSQDAVRFDRAHFHAYGDYALLFEFVYYVLSPDYNTHMDIQQAVNLGIFEAFEKAGIEFAYPTQTLYVSQAAAAADLRPG